MNRKPINIGSTTPIIIPNLERKKLFFLFNSSRPMRLHLVPVSNVGMFLETYTSVMKSQGKVSLFMRLFNETLVSLKVIESIRDLNGLDTLYRITNRNILLSYIKTKHRDIKFIQQSVLNELDLVRIIKLKIGGSISYIDENTIQNAYQDIFSD